MGFDIIFISYDEDEAERNYQDLLTHYPLAKRVHGTQGIRAAHEKASQMAQTEYFFTVDGDNRFIPGARLNIPGKLIKDSVYVWRCQNPVNGLVYGYGGVKLWDRRIFTRAHLLAGDHSMNATKNYIIVNDVATITHFNTSPYASWRAAFREVIKLQHNIFLGIDNVSQGRLDSWLNPDQNSKYASLVSLGAKQGVAHYLKDKAHSLDIINDYSKLNIIFKGLHNEQ